MLEPANKNPNSDLPLKPTKFREDDDDDVIILPIPYFIFKIIYICVQFLVVYIPIYVNWNLFGTLLSE